MISNELCRNNTGRLESDQQWFHLTDRFRLTDKRWIIEPLVEIESYLSLNYDACIITIIYFIKSL